MSSIVPGFEYDIFISYRHKDNKGDHWVTEFVNALKTELEATFKEDISIYFDENPHDGLLETHDVDDSLKEKLKCLIFIPIISQTYCDPKSFAWNHEFLAFKKLASAGQLGLKVKLANSNVASRILPVRIHELDSDDRTLIENEVGPLRSVDFIFKSAGVNRPLTQNDKREENTNKTYYRDQVNKVANAVKEIVVSFSSKNDSNIQSKEGRTNNEVSIKKRPKKIAALVGIVFILFLAVYFTITAGRAEPSKLELSISVLPFKNLSKDTAQEYYGIGLADDITDRLAKIKSLRVISRTSSNQYETESQKSIQVIAQELNVSYILEGSVRRQGGKVKVVAQLIDARKDEHLWSETIEEEEVDIFKIQAAIANKIARYLQLSLSVNEKGELVKVPTQSIEAYDLFLRGNALLGQLRGSRRDEAIILFRKSISLDAEYASALEGLASAYLLKGFRDSAVFYASKCIVAEPNNGRGYGIMGYALDRQEKIDEAYTYLLRATKLGEGFQPMAGFMVGRRGRIDSAIYYNRFVILKPRESESLITAYVSHGRFFLELEMYDSARYYFNKAYLVDPKHIFHKMPMARLLIITKEYDKALKFLDECILNIENEKETGFIRTAKGLVVRIHGFKKDWAAMMKSYTSPFDLDEELFLALALKKSGESKKSMEIVKKLKDQLRDQNNMIGLARIAILEDSLPKAASLYEEGFSLNKITSNQFSLDPFSAELSNTIELKPFLSKIELRNKQVIASIKSMDKK